MSRNAFVESDVMPANDDNVDDYEFIVEKTCKISKKSFRKFDIMIIMNLKIIMKINPKKLLKNLKSLLRSLINLLMNLKLKTVFE